jgi:hypothetical protein
MPVELDEVTSAGFSAVQVLQAVGTPRTVSLRYADGSRTELTFDFELVGPAQSSTACGYLQLPMRVDAASSDGTWFGADRNITFFSSSAKSATFALVGEASSFGLDPTRFAVGKHATYDLSVLVTLGNAEASGSVAIIGHDPEHEDTTYLLGTVAPP